MIVNVATIYMYMYLIFHDKYKVMNGKSPCICEGIMMV